VVVAHPDYRGIEPQDKLVRLSSSANTSQRLYELADTHHYNKGFSRHSGVAGCSLDYIFGANWSKFFTGLMTFLSPINSAQALK